MYLGSMNERIWLEIAVVAGGLFSLLVTYYRQKHQNYSGLRLVSGYITGTFIFLAGVVMLLLDYYD